MFSPSYPPFLDSGWGACYRLDTMVNKHYLLFSIGFLLLACAAGQVQSAPPTAGPTPDQLVLPAIKRDCATCHRTHGSILLLKPLEELCIGCHPERMTPNEHKVDIVPSLKVEKLPLQNNKITCITCHDPHANAFGAMLRVPAKQLCLLCHRK